MSWTIYKPGQGYWTRLISGLAGGILVVAAAAWLWNVIGGFNLEWTSSQSVTLAAPTHTEEGQDAQAAFGISEITETVIGTDDAKRLTIARVASGTPAAAAGLLPRDIITSVGDMPVKSLADVKKALAAAPATGLVIQINRGEPIGIFIQAAVAIIIITVFGLLLFKWVAVKPNTTDFLIATEGEMKKVNWPNKREIVGSTWIVIVALALFVAILFFSDFLFLHLFKFLRVLDI